MPQTQQSQYLLHVLYTVIMDIVGYIQQHGIVHLRCCINSIHFVNVDSSI